MSVRDCIITRMIQDISYKILALLEKRRLALIIRFRNKEIYFSLIRMMKRNSELILKIIIIRKAIINSLI
jgi:hypothetical protein